jgi:hypothetical protein
MFNQKESIWQENYAESFIDAYTSCYRSGRRSQLKILNPLYWKDKEDLKALYTETIIAMQVLNYQ